jgi:2-oxoisovalerate dehydrogenase E1 component
LYRSIYGDVPKDYYTLPFGKANLLRKGASISIVTYGAGVHWASEVLEKHPNIEADLVDLRTLQPLDMDTVYTSVKKTGKLIILQEDTLFGGIASDISAMVMEECFRYLDAPIKRVGSLETPVPFAKELEENYLPKQRFESALLNLYAY